MDIDVAIVGAGPAGGFCAFSLAKEGLRPVVFDHSHPREKPCGGGLSPFAQEAFPFLKELSFIHAEPDQIQVIYLRDKAITLTVKRKFIIASRLRLDQHILDMATANGARLQKQRVIELKRCREGWKVSTGKSIHKVRTLIGADGVHSLVRKATIGSFRPTDLGLCYGYFTKTLPTERMLLRFLSERKGYIWLFPRGDHACVGIAADMTRSSGLKTELDRFLKTRHVNLEGATQWAALVPTLHLQTFQRPVAGANWMLIGDAAGHVDPVSGEGIPYALRSAELAAEAIFQHNPRLYDQSWREDYGKFLLRSAMLKDFVFNKYLCTPYFVLASLLSERLAI